MRRYCYLERGFLPHKIGFNRGNVELKNGKTFELNSPFLAMASKSVGLLKFQRFISVILPVVFSPCFLLFGFSFLRVCLSSICLSIFLQERRFFWTEIFIHIH